MMIWSINIGPFNRTQVVYHNVLLSYRVIHSRIPHFLGETTRLRNRDFSCLEIINSCLWCEEIGYNVQLWFLFSPHLLPSWMRTAPLLNNHPGGGSSCLRDVHIFSYLVRFIGESS